MDAIGLKYNALVSPYKLRLPEYNSCRLFTASLICLEGSILEMKFSCRFLFISECNITFPSLSIMQKPKPGGNIVCITEGIWMEKVEIAPFSSRLLFAMMILKSPLVQL